MLITAKAWDAFEKNMEDVDRLVAVHQLLVGPTRGRKHGVEVLNKSALMLITAYWEAFCEDFCIEAFDFLLAHTTQPRDFPVDVRIIVGRELKADKDERRLWGLAGDGWKHVLKSYRDEVLKRWVDRLNTPKARHVDDLFKRTIGIVQVSAAWKWPGMSRANARKRLDHWIELRGAIAHRGKAAKSIVKDTVTQYRSHVNRIVEHTTVSVARYVARRTGARSLFR